MALRFRLKGLAETFIEEATCPCCGLTGSDDASFSTELTRVTKQGIVVVLQCRACSFMWVPTSQRLGVVNPTALLQAVEKDSRETGEAAIEGIEAVRNTVEHLNVERRGGIV